MRENFGEFEGGTPHFSGIPEAIINPETPDKDFAISNSSESNRWNSDSRKNFDLREQIFDMTRRLTFLPNEESAANKIIGDLNISDPLMKRFVRAEVGIRGQVNRVKRLEMLERDKNYPNRNNEIHRILLKNAEHYSQMAEQIRENPDDSKVLWEHQERIANKKTSNAERSGILALVGVEKTITKDLRAVFENVSADKDVKEATDGIITIENENGEKEDILCQVKSVYSKDENTESFNFVKDHMVTVLYRSLADRIKNKSMGFSSGIYSKKSKFIIEKERQLSKITDKIFLNNDNKRAVVLYMPTGNVEVNGKLEPSINDDGSMNEKIKKLFLEQFNAKVLGKTDNKSEIKKADLINRK